MATTRIFTDFSPDDRGGLAMAQVPKDGLCIAAFLILQNQEGDVLMGKVNPAAEWDHIGALDPERVQRHRDSWMLPSSHLQLFESPQEASQRILQEQLELRDVELSRPSIFSNVRALKRAPDAKHWDLNFAFRGKISEGQMPAPGKAWAELRFLRVQDLSNYQITHLHRDVIASSLSSG